MGVRERTPIFFGIFLEHFCTIAMKYGVGIIRDLESGTSFLMQERGIRSVRDRLLDLSVKVPYWRPRHAERTPEELAVLQEH